METVSQMDGLCPGTSYGPLDDLGLNNNMIPIYCGQQLLEGAASPRQWHHIGSPTQGRLSFEDPQFLTHAQFPDLGAVPLSGRVGCADGYGCTTSADYLNQLGGSDDATPTFLSGPVTTAGGHTHSHSFPSSFPGVPEQRPSSPEAEGPEAAPAPEQEEEAEEERQVHTGRKGAKGKGSKRAPAARAGRKGGVAKARGGGRKAQVAAAAPVKAAPAALLFTGTIGGSGTMQAHSMPWTLSLLRLNELLSGAGGAAEPPSLSPEGEP